MSNLKSKISSMLLAVALVIGLMPATALATGSSGSITITNVDSANHTFSAYQIFDGDYSGGVLTNTITWGSGVDENKTSAIYSALASIAVTVDSATVYPFTSDKTSNGTVLTSAADVAKALETYNTNSAVYNAFAATISSYLSSTATASTSNGDEHNDDTYTYTMSGLSYGYYLVKDSDSSTNTTVSNIVLKVVGSVSMETKSSSVPTVDKTANGSTATSASVGDSVSFVLTGTVPAAASSYTSYTYQFVDTLSDGLTYDTSSSGLAVTSSASSTPLTAGTDYTVSTSTDSDESTVLTITINNAEKRAGETITVSYSATLNSNAAVGTPETNAVKVNYSNDPYSSGTGTSAVKTTYVHTFGISGTKVDSTNTSTYLSGATFRIYKTSDDTASGTKSYATLNSDGKVTGWTSDADDAGTVTSADTAGAFSISGLAEGTYFLEETVAPSGYNTLTSAVKIVIDATYSDDGSTVSALKVTVTVGNSTTTTDSTDKQTVSVTVENSKGSTMPQTGDMGTMVFYVLGGILVVAAGVVLVTRRRMADKE